jgi:hypothetical protein
MVSELSKRQHRALKTGLPPTSTLPGARWTEVADNRPDFEEDGLGKIMNSVNTWLTCVFGFAVFALGGFARQYMLFACTDGVNDSQHHDTASTCISCWSITTGIANSWSLT